MSHTKDDLKVVREALLVAAYSPTQTPHETEKVCEALRVIDRLESQATSPPMVAVPDKEAICAIVSEAMQFCWDDFCADTGNHPPDITQHPRRNLSFQPFTWAEWTGERVAHNVLKLLAAPSTSTEKESG